MDFSLSQEQQQLKALAHDFARNEIRPISAAHDHSGRISRRGPAKGLGIRFDEHAYSGSVWGTRLGWSMAPQWEEETAWGCTGVSTAMEANTLAEAPIIVAGTEEQKKVPRQNERGILIRCYGVTEPNAGSDVAAIKTTAVRKGDVYVLNGEKMWITNAGKANWFFVLAKTDSDKGHRGMTGFIVDADSPGLTLGRKEWNMGQRASDTRAVKFEDVEVPQPTVWVKKGMALPLR